MEQGGVVQILRDALRRNFSDYAKVIALLVIWLLFGVLTDWIFFSPRNLSNLFRQMTIISFLAVGMVIVIVTGNIDLSVGSITGFVSVICAYLQAQFMPRVLPTLFPDMSGGGIAIISTVLTVLSALAVGFLVGIWQGALIAYLKIPAFIVTLGGMAIFRGGVIGVTGGRTIQPVTDTFRLIAQGYLRPTVGLVLGILVVAGIFLITVQRRNLRQRYGFSLNPLFLDMLKASLFSAVIMAYVLLMNAYRGVQNPVFLLAIVAVIGTYITNNTRFGRYAYAIGGNQEAARLSGINIERIIFRVFIMMGMISAVSGIVLTGYVAAGTVSGGERYELDTIAACVIGGASLMGGEGTIFGAIVGSLIMASILNGMSVMNLGVFLQFVVRGLVLILAVYIDVVSKRRA
ncbi:MAG: sugar ABC transporter permease [Spirochaetaceae bacterium]